MNREPYYERCLGQREGRRRLLDLFCGAGGAAVGYHRAGFEVVGVDIEPQPRYPFEFHQLDAMAMRQDVGAGCWHELGSASALPGASRVCLGRFDAVHASPPCPRYSACTPEDRRMSHPDLVAAVRDLVVAAGVVYVIENVEGAPLDVVPTLLSERAGTMLCGSMFGLRVRRHRLFESNAPLPQPSCRHATQGTPLSVTGSGYGGKHRGHNGTKPSGIVEAREVMGIPWMTIRELSQAIPPAYTEFVGRHLLAAVEERAA